jgi:hypothetical protein
MSRLVGHDMTLHFHRPAFRSPAHHPHIILSTCYVSYIHRIAVADSTWLICNDIICIAPTVTTSTCFLVRPSLPIVSRADAIYPVTLPIIDSIHVRARCVFLG